MAKRRKSKEKEYQAERNKLWKSAKLRATTIKKLRTLELALDLHNYDDVINRLINDSKMLQNFKWAKF